MHVRGWVLGPPFVNLYQLDPITLCNIQILIVLGNGSLLHEPGLALCRCWSFIFLDYLIQVGTSFEFGQIVLWSCTCMCTFKSADCVKHTYIAWYQVSFDNFALKMLFLFTELIEEAYYNKSKNPYHNSMHAADVCQAMHCYLQEEKVRIPPLTSI